MPQLTQTQTVFLKSSSDPGLGPSYSRLPLYSPHLGFPVSPTFIPSQLPSLFTMPSADRQGFEL